MIKSDLMNRKILLVMVLFFLLTGCGQQRQPDVEHFQGEVIATLQKPISQAVTDLVTDPPPPREETQPSPETSQTIPANTPMSAFTPTFFDPQTTSYPAGTEPTSVAPTPTAMAYPYQTPNPTPGVTEWQGVWNIWYQNTRGGYTPSELTVQVSGTSVTGLAKIDGIDFIFTGDILAQTSQVEGEWETASSNGTFWWRMNSPDTFVGSSEERFGFCGNRVTTVQPNPCREVPQD